MARVLQPIRRLIGRVGLHDQPSHIDAAARFKAWQLEGDYLEFGVYTGQAFVEAYHTIKKAERTRHRTSWNTRFYAFDSFQGLPKPKGLDTYYDQYAEGAYAATETQFRSNLVKNNVDLEDVVIVPGYYSELMQPENQTRHADIQAAVVFFDCDLYESTQDALRFLTDKLMDGSILIFADWFLFQANPQLGQKRAFYEWLEANPQFEVSTFCSIPGVFYHSFQLHRKLDRT